MKNIKAIFCDDNIIVSKTKRPAGIYSKILLNNFSDKNGRFPIEEALEKESRIIGSALESLLIPEMIIETKGIPESIIRCLNAVRKLFPFNMSYEVKYISLLFSESNINDVNMLRESRQLRKENTYEYQLSDSQLVLHTLDIENEMEECLLFFNNISHDVSIAYTEIKKIADSFSEMDRHYENDLLSTAVGLLKNWNTAELKTEYVSIPADDETETLGRKMIFTSYRDFIIADLFEGIHHGHYVRKCIICKKYFFMTKAYNQQVCSGRTDIRKKYEDGFYTCRQYANKIKRRDKAKNDPIKNIYTSRCSQLRRSKGRGIITEEFYDVAFSIAKAHMEKASYNEEYANGQYENDMTQKSIYTETERKLKNV